MPLFIDGFQSYKKHPLSIDRKVCSIIRKSTGTPEVWFTLVYQGEGKALKMALFNPWGRRQPLTSMAIF